MHQQATTTGNSVEEKGKRDYSAMKGNRKRGQ